jgi:hypothetical protein
MMARRNWRVPTTRKLSRSTIQHNRDDQNWIVR